MSEPVVSYPLRAVLDRIEADMRDIRDHVSKLETGGAVQAAEAAAGRARTALWVAAASPVLSVLVAWWVSRH